MGGIHYTKDELYMIAAMRGQGLSIPTVAKQLALKRTGEL
jgi:hypothetical protein